MIIHRTEGKTSRYVLIDNTTGDVVSDAVILFPLTDRDAASALMEIVNKYGGSEQLKIWTKHVMYEWEAMNSAKAWDKP